MKIIWNNFDVVWIFCSFNDVFISSYSFKMFWEVIGLLSSYHNRGLGAAIRRDVGWGVRVEGVYSSIGDCWKGLGIGSPLKCLWNSEAVEVRRMPKVSEVGVGKTPKCFWSEKQVIPWYQHYANQTPKLQAPLKPSNTLLSLSENSEPFQNPDHIPVFICLYHSILVLLNSELIFMSLSQFSPFHFWYIKLFQYLLSCSSLYSTIVY